MKNISLEKYLNDNNIDLRILDFVEEAYDMDVHTHKQILADKNFVDGMYPFIDPQVLLPVWKNKDTNTVEIKKFRVGDWGRNAKIEAFIQMFDKPTMKKLMKQYCIFGWTIRLIDKAKEENFDLNSVVFND